MRRKEVTFSRRLRQCSEPPFPYSKCEEECTREENKIPRDQPDPTADGEDWGGSKLSGGTSSYQTKEPDNPGNSFFIQGGVVQLFQANSRRSERQAAIEAAFFFQETKQAVNRLAEKTPKNLSSNPPPLEQQAQADVLPEVLKHSLPSKVFRQPSDPSSLSRASKWALHSNPNNGSGSSPDALNPLRAYLSFPQVTFGPKRSQLWPFLFKTNSGFSFLFLFSYCIWMEKFAGGSCRVRRIPSRHQRLMNCKRTNIRLSIRRS
ncbi:uncharacterized protein LOC120139143 [Hibiscus syriacus]|uniref:uncharacterized protein LOC120139143 n=1 Tax=Hibiscus syriacus TaxID=106335 RepID=UPI001924816E|nr:uncharacterized protein LOC120139143 [Hibiscus syriacus]